MGAGGCFPRRKEKSPGVCPSQKGSQRRPQQRDGVFPEPESGRGLDSSVACLGPDRGATARGVLNRTVM